MQTPAQLGRLADYRQFILVHFVPDPEKPGKTLKHPVDPQGLYRADAHNPAIWMDAATAYALAEALGTAPGADGSWYGPGFTFTAADPFFFLDIDHCASVDGQWSPLALELCQTFAGAMVEVSQSGTGLHVIGMYSGECPPHKCKPRGTGLELYHEVRFVALGRTVDALGSVAYDHSAALSETIARLFAPGEDSEGGSDEWTDSAPLDYAGPEDDAELLNRACRVRPSLGATFGNKATFAQLFAGDEEALGRAFPPQNSVDPFDRSSADAALFQHLAYWTGNNCERMERLARMSGLVRDKWDRADYLRERTILGATRRQTTYPKAAPAPAPGAKPDPAAQAAAAAVAQAGTPPGAGLWVFLHEIPQLFAGWTYIQDLHAAISPEGRAVKPEAFRALFGGHKWVIDSEGKVERDAWTAFTQCEGWRAPYAVSTCFRPDRTPGAIIEVEGLKLANTWQPIDVTKRQGDPSRFLELLSLQLPDARDREILLSYAAAIVQKPGRKFQWWPVIQGVEGNGKSMIARIISYAVGRRYSFFPNVDEISKNGVKFNGWVEGHLFLSLEEIYVPNRRDFLESFKSIVTNSIIPIEKKGVDVRVGDNFANGMMYTNHRNGIPIGVDGRRYAVFYTAQQTKADLARDGMTGEYFPDFYDWLAGRGKYAELGIDYGYSVLADFLANYPIAAEFDPSYRCNVAPQTSSTGAALIESQGTVEQEIMEQVEQGAPGFAGGWISSLAVDRLLERMNLSGKVPRATRRDLLRSLGYVPHPMLPDGRCNNTVSPDNGKPRLYVKPGHLSCQLPDASAVARAYQQAQGIIFGAQQARA